jgi:hypothetical protein
MMNAHPEMIEVGGTFVPAAPASGPAPVRSAYFSTALLRCRVSAWSVLRGSAKAIAQWRKEPIVRGGKSSLSLLKNSEDQTVLGWRSVHAAIEQQHWQERSFADWGVIAAPNLCGRVTNAQSLHLYQKEGAWGISPHLIPHQSLHAMSGTISQALQLHGPNFGVSGAPNASPDAFLIAAAMMMDGRLPGLWVVLTGYETEWIPAADGRPTQAPMCQAVALALTASLTPGPSPGGRGENLGEAAGLHLSLGHGAADAVLPDFCLARLADALTPAAGTPAVQWRLGDTHWLALAPEARP